MEIFQYISANNNTCYASQPINLPWKVHFELVNKSTNIIFSIYKRQKLYLLTTLIDGVEELKVKYTNIQTFFKKILFRNYTTKFKNEFVLYYVVFFFFSPTAFFRP